MSTAAVQSDWVSVEDYLAAEEQSEVRHEYLGGYVYALSGGTRRHNTICLNLAQALRQHLKGGPCQVYMSDVRVRLFWDRDEYYYYPDIVVTCDSRDTHPRFVRHPVLLMEVLSDSTRRVDQRKKLFAYRQLESLQEYVLVEPSWPEAVLYRRDRAWAAEVAAGKDAVLTLASLDLELPLKEVYEGL